MSKLSSDAKAYCVEVLKNQGREALVSMLENIGVACYDDEDDYTLAEAAADSVEAGDIEFDWGHSYASSLPRHIYMAWLDIEDVWI
jgi:hypothetical protein